MEGPVAPASHDPGSDPGVVWLLESEDPSVRYLALGDPRAGEALDLVEQARRPDGT